ncbi:MAG: hypothetical protein KKD05_09035 [Candidatus Omnitrophica bacterium]|nr:hypothetical protein [Candidatus Omnitrophota bacterium]
MPKIKTKDLSKKLKTILPIHLLDLLRDIGELADKKKVAVYIVGGFVRDMLIGISNFDIDLVIEGDAIAFSKDLKEKLNAKLKISPRFKTAKLLLNNGLSIDLAMARTEFYAYPAALPIVESSSLVKDLSRRDFTINTLALSLNKKTFGILIDSFEASRDLKQKRIKILHDLSFMDDPTRILRAVRFEQRFNFRIDKYTQNLILAAIDKKILKKAEKFRMTNELILLLNEPNPLKVIRRMNTFDELDFIHPNIKFNKSLSKKIKAVAEIIKCYKKYCQDLSVKIWMVYLMAIIDDLNIHDLKEIFAVFNFNKKDKDILLEIKQTGGNVLEALHFIPVRKISELAELLKGRAVEECLFLINKSKKTGIKKMFIEYLVKYVNVKLDN